MAANEVRELLESAAPTPKAPLDIDQVERRADRRRFRRRMTVGAASLLVIGALTGLAAEIPDSRGPDTVVAGPAGSRKIRVEFRGDAATTQIRLLDGTQLRLTLPRALGEALAGMTFANLELHGSLYAEIGAQPPHGWRMDVSLGSVENLIPGGERLVVPSASLASAAVVDRAGRRLGLQFGSWTLVASGDSMTEADIDALLAGISFVETPDGYVEYQGSLPLWLVDSPDVAVTDGQVGVSVFMGDHCPLTGATRRTAHELDSYRIENPAFSGRLTELCDHASRLRIGLRAPRPLSDDELDAVRVDVLSVGRTLAAVQRGERP